MDRHQLKAKREQLGLNQGEMAARLFMTRQHYNTLESGSNNITKKTAALVRALRRRGA